MQLLVATVSIAILAVSTVVYAAKKLIGCKKLTPYSYSIVADGCGLGFRAREAAQRAVAIAATTINASFKQPRDIKTAEDIANIMLKARIVCPFFIGNRY